jgi:hypothetical protein
VNTASPAPIPEVAIPTATRTVKASRLKSIWQRRRQLKDAAAGFDLRKALILATLLPLSMLALSIPNTTVQEIIPWLLMIGALTTAAYFGHILLFRLQCSLLEFCLIIAALGNLEGMLLTTPGIFSIGREWVMVLAPLGVAWLFYGAVIGLMQAELCGRRGAFMRLFHIVSGWLNTGALAMLGMGTALWLYRHDTKMLTRNVSAWAIPLMVLGALGLVLRFWLGRSARRAAKELVFSATPEATK